MLHYSPAKKNKHQNEYRTLPLVYLYEDHISSKKLSNHLSAETRAELNDDIYYMRRQFKRTAKKLARHLYYTDWMKNKLEEETTNTRMKLHPRHA